MGWRWFGIAAEVAGTAGASDTWSSAGAGNAVLDLRVLFGGTVTNALGVRVALPVGERFGPLGPVSWWGTVPSATVPAAGLALAWEGATPRWVWHVQAGLRGGDSYSTAFEVQPLDLQANVATVQPVGGAWSAVVELELLIEQSPVHVRGLARAELGHGWTADVGLAVPFAVFFDDPTLQVLGAARRSW